MNSIYAVIITIVLTIITGFILISRKYSLTPKEISFPFLKFDTHRFEDLSCARLFREVSRQVIVRNPIAEVSAEKIRLVEPLILVHAGWTFVCDSFVMKYKKFPDDTAIGESALHIGTQNALFVKMYRQLYEQSVRYSDKITYDFAEDYFARAPSLAQRISDSHVRPSDTFELIEEWVRNSRFLEAP
jgi:hypothetical protein